MDDDLRKFTMESLPEPVVAALEVRNAWRQAVVASGEGLEFIVAGLEGWAPGSTVRVAFLGGTAELHRKIAEATAQITDAANLVLDFGETAEGRFRQWSTDDVQHAAEIRVSFDMDGFFSLIGTDSTDRFLAPAGQLVGGRPDQRSLNLEAFDIDLPDDWEGTVRHEFLHALAFKHEHQNPSGPCQDEFRWVDDPGYLPTTNSRGMFVADANGLRPGIYTFLAGEPNGWSRAKVDHNLKTKVDPAVTPGDFDQRSVMLYRFDSLFYKTIPSPCAPLTEGIDLSEGDQRGLRLLYPHDPDAVAEQTDRAQEALDRVGAGQEAGGLPSNPYADRVVELLKARVG
jgi:hypothetical protein